MCETGNDDGGYFSSTIDCPVNMAVKEYTAIDLWEQAWSMAGKSLFYMEFLHPDIDFEPQKIKSSLIS